MIVDHTSVALYNQIPSVYMTEIKKICTVVAGESHAVGTRKGAELLNNIDENYPASVDEVAPPEAYRDDAYRIDGFYWTGFSYQPLIGEALWYTNASGIATMKASLDKRVVDGYTPSILMFGWCWDMTWANGPTTGYDPVHKCRWWGSSDGGPEGNLAWGLDAADASETDNTVCLDTYLAATEEYISYCASEEIPTKIVFSTGPVDGDSGEVGYQRHLKHERIRDYVLANPTKTLFDYADILAWNDAGQQNLQQWVDAEEVSHDYQLIHSDNMVGDEYGHIGAVGCVRLGKALWVLAAMALGWNGVDISRSSHPRFRKRVVT